ncbi:MAG: copper chaperone PCu(A)C [Vicinamibacterales bacterium]
MTAITRRVPLLLSALLVAWPMLAGAQGKEPTAVSAWVAAPAAGATSAVAYVEITNPTMYEIFVVSATADAAGKVELRGAGADAPVVTEFPVQAYGSTAAEAGAPHLRLLELKKPLAAGDAVALVLTTDSGVQMKVSATVRAQ